MGWNINDPYTETGAPYPEAFTRYQPRPRIPEDFSSPSDALAGVARRGPFSVQTKAAPDRRNQFVIDLSALEALEPRAPFIPAGGVAHFERGPGNTLKTLGVEFQGDFVEPGQARWALTEKRFLVGLNSYTTFIEHLTFIHIATAGVLSIVARMAFSARHPLRVLIQPFTAETNRVNNYNIDGLILTPKSNVPSYSGYSLEQASTLLRASAEDFDLRLIDPEFRAGLQGTLDDPTFPTVESAVSVYRIFKRFTETWCKHYLKTIDLETRIFCEEFDYRSAKGIRGLLGVDRWEELDHTHIAHLLAVCFFGASVGHHIVNDLTRNYFMSFHRMPTAIDSNGFPTWGVVLEKQESVVSAGSQRYKLLSEPKMPDLDAQRMWDTFQNELRAYERGLPPDPLAADYYIYPSRVACSVHA